MGLTLNYFKEYKIEQDKESFDKRIRYYGGGQIEYSYSSILKISLILSLSGIDIQMELNFLEKMN